MTARRVTPGYRLAVAGRALAAAAGGYAVAALLGVLLAVALPGDPLDRGMAGTLAALLLLPAIAMFCFWVRSAGRAWATVLLLAAGLAGLSLLSGWRP